MRFPSFASRDFESMGNPDVNKACNAFLEQVLPWVPLESVAMVLLDDNQSTSRVVFFWQATEPKGARLRSSIIVGDGITRLEIVASSLALAGSAGILGAVLIRASASAGPLDTALFHNAARVLAGQLEEFVKQQRLDRSGKEVRAFSRIKVQAASGQTVERAYRCFVHEIKDLLDFQLFTLFIIDRKAGMLTCAYQADSEGREVLVEQPRRLAETGCERLTFAPSSRIIDDLRLEAGNIWPELSGEPGFRSAIIAPLNHNGNVFGAAIVRNRYPKAFGTFDDSIFSRAVDLLVPAMVNPTVIKSQTLDRQPMSLEVSDIIAGSRSIEEMFDLVVDAAGKMIQFDLASMAWLDPNGYDIHTLQSKLGGPGELNGPGELSGPGELNGPGKNYRPSRSTFDKATPEDSLVWVQTRLQFVGENLGTLRLARSSEMPFSKQDLRALDILATHMSVAVRNERSNRRQAWTRSETMLDLAYALRTPLTSIKGYSGSLLQTDISWPPEVRKEFLETIDQQADRLNRVIDDLMSTNVSVRSQPEVERLVTTMTTLWRLGEGKLLTSAHWQRSVRFQATLS